MEGLINPSFEKLDQLASRVTGSQTRRAENTWFFDLRGKFPSFPRVAVGGTIPIWKDRSSGPSVECLGSTDVPPELPVGQVVAPLIAIGVAAPAWRLLGKRGSQDVLTHCS